MGRSNPVEGLANALQDCIEPPGRERRTEKLANALQACLNHAVAEGVREVREVEKRVDARLDKQDETLRLIWKQVKGSGDSTAAFSASADRDSASLSASRSTINCPGISR